MNLTLYFEWRSIMSRFACFIGALIILLSVGGVVADEVSVLPAWHEVDEPPIVRPLRSGEKKAVAAVAVLQPAVKAEAAALATMVKHNQAGRPPLQQGFARSLGKRIRVDLETGLSAKQMPVATSFGMVDRRANGNLVLMTRVDVNGAWGVRLHLANVNLPKQTRMWVYTPGQEAVGPFGLELLRPGLDLICPSVFGSEVWLEVEIPAAALSDHKAPGFSITEVGELFPPEALGAEQPTKEDDFSCLVNAPCVDLDSIGLTGYDRSVAYLQFEDGGSYYICSGTLVNDKDVDGFIPYLLTANHCFSTQASATTLESYFDYKTNGCSGSTPSIGTLPRTVGSTLLATAEGSDFTFVQLASSPTGSRYYMGWTTSVQADGTDLYRISHPSGKPAAYSRSLAEDYPVYVCSGSPQSSTVYSLHTDGSTWSGSSGSSVVKSNGQIVGQLTGKCGPEGGWEDCDDSISVIDGSLRTTYSSISSWLAPDTSSCVSSINHNSTINGTWTSSCASANRSGRYAKFYTFTLSSAADVQIDLSSSPDNYLYLLSGSGSGGSIVAEDDDAGGSQNARISESLNAGTYTIEATTYPSSTTGSFTLTLAVTGSGGDYQYMVAGIAAAPGAGGSNWKSYLSVTNRSGQSASLTLIYRYGSGSVTRTRNLNKNNSIGWNNVVSSLFGVGGSTSGSVEVQSTQPVFVQARTFNDTAGGTYGQYLPGVTLEEMIGNGVTGLLGQIRGAYPFRTNIGFVNPGSSSCSVSIKIYSTGGFQLGTTKSYTVAAGGWKQVNDVFSATGAGSINLAYAIVQVSTSGCKVWAYASVVDRESGDPTTIPVILLQ
jgi:V8-like Glu-specific endopeptidase